jgi:hypothetical protein
MFVERYVRGPIQTLLAEGDKPLLDLHARAQPNTIDIGLGLEILHISRSAQQPMDDSGDPMPPDADDAIPGA